MPSAGAIKIVEGLNPYQKLLLAIFGTKTKPELPKLRDIAQARDIDRKGNDRYIWTACPRCHKERWLLMYNLKYSKYNGLCINCYNQRGTNKQYSGGGYIKVKLQPNDLFYPMAKKDGYILEHRLVMAQHLGRCLHSWEIVNHRNGNKEDNRIENLQLGHAPTFVLAGKIKCLEERITLLEAENTLFRAQVNKVTERNEQAAEV